jgi:hypothetical protein
MWRDIAMSLIVQSIYKSAAGKPWISAFRDKKQNMSISSRSNFIARGVQKNS